MFAKKLKELRIQHNFSQQEVSLMLGVSAGTVGMWEQGRRTPPVAMIEKIALLFGVHVAVFFESEDPEETQSSGCDDSDQPCSETDAIISSFYQLDCFGRIAVEQLIRSELIRCAMQKTIGGDAAVKAGLEG